ncbi:hypothetical protein LPJ56_004904, partial [Coemansia sp. RSA 2599]
SCNDDVSEENGKNSGLFAHFSASMPHLPSRLNGPRDSAQSSVPGVKSDKKRLFVESAEGMPASLSGLVDVAPGSSAASSLLMFPIDFTSTTPASASGASGALATSSCLSSLLAAEQGPKAGAVSGVVRKTRSSSISEIRQRLTRRLSRSSGSSGNGNSNSSGSIGGRQGRRRSGSNSSSPVTSPTSRSQNLSNSAQQSKRLFTGNGSSPLIAEELSRSDKAKSDCLAADELVRGLESLSIDGAVDRGSGSDDSSDANGAGDDALQDEKPSTSRLLSESIDLVLEKRLNTSGLDRGASSSDKSESSCDDSARAEGRCDKDDLEKYATANGSLLADPAAISESLSLLTLSDTVCKDGSKAGQQAAGQDVVDVVDYEDYVYLSTHEVGQSQDPEHGQGLRNGKKDATGNEENTRPASIDGALLDGSRRWWPRRVLPVQNMQYMPKLSKLFAEISQLNANAGSLGSLRNCDYVCADCLALAQPVDEAMMTDVVSGSFRDCRDIECKNYLLQNSSSGSSTTLKEWSYSNSLSGLTLADIGSSSSGGSGGVPLDIKGSRKLDYWDVLSRCPMRPTSSLALSSLKAMAKS